MMNLNIKEGEYLTPYMFPSICRTCCIYSTELLLIDNYNSDGITLKEIIKNFTNLQFNDDDLLPRNMCKPCINTMYDIYKFLRKCTKTAEMLQKVLTRSYGTTDGDIQFEVIPIKKEKLEYFDDYVNIQKKEIIKKEPIVDVEIAQHDEPNNNLEEDIKTEEIDIEENDIENFMVTVKTNLKETDHQTRYQNELEAIIKADKIAENQSETIDITNYEEAMSSDSDCNDDDQSTSYTQADHTSLSLLQEKSQKRYIVAYNRFMDWQKEKNIKLPFSEPILLKYFLELAEKVRPTTLWGTYSMLRSSLISYHNVNISGYTLLRALLKRKSVGYKPKKTQTLTSEEIHRFLDEAPDEKYLFTKVALIVGIMGVCRKQELVQLKIDNIKYLKSSVSIEIVDSRSKQPRLFVISGKYYEYFKKYALLRPRDVNESRFFLNYQNQTCTKQPVGINKIGAVPKQVATYLKLKNPEFYTGHCFRRVSSAIISGNDQTQTV